MLDAERARVLELRSTGRVPHEVVEDVLASLDIEESMIDTASTVEREVVRSRAGVTVDQAVDACDHLEAGAARPPRSRPRCEDCVREGSTLGAPADVPDLRPRRLLRLLAATARRARTTRRPTTRSCAPPSPERRGAGASSTRWSG